MTLVKTFALDGTKNGKITIGTITEPYGEGSGSVASVAISLNAKSAEPDWKVHIPKANIDEVIAALTEAKHILS